MRVDRRRGDRGDRGGGHARADPPGGRPRGGPAAGIDVVLRAHAGGAAVVDDRADRGPGPGRADRRRAGWRSPSRVSCSRRSPRAGRGCWRATSSRWRRRGARSCGRSYDEGGLLIRRRAVEVLTAAGSAAPRRHARVVVDWMEGTIFGALAGTGSLAPPTFEALVTAPGRSSRGSASPGLEVPGVAAWSTTIPASLAGDRHPRGVSRQASRRRSTAAPASRATAAQAAQISKPTHGAYGAAAWSSGSAARPRPLRSPPRCPGSTAPAPAAPATRRSAAPATAARSPTPVFPPRCAGPSRCPCTRSQQREVAAHARCRREAAPNVVGRP